MRSLGGEDLSDKRAGDLNVDRTRNQDAATCKAELSEGLTEFLLRKIIQLQTQPQSEIALPKLGENETHRWPGGPGMEAA